MVLSYDEYPPQLLNPLPPTRADIHAFLSRHLDLLAAERQAEIDQTSLLASNCSPKLLEKRGLAIGSLGVSSISVGLGGKTQIELHLPSAYHNSPILPPHTFRTGDPARLEANPSNSNASAKKKSKGAGDGKSVNKNGEDEGVEGVVAKVTNEKITLSVESGKDLELPERLRLLKLANSGTFDRMEATLRHVARIMLSASFEQDQIIGNTFLPRPHNADLMDVLFGLRKPTRIEIAKICEEPKADLSPAEANGSGIQWFDSTLNDSQKRAVEFALCANEVACIHGPPGTGKTFTLVEIVRQLVLIQKKRVLICGASNLAVDNLLARLAPLFPPSGVVRLGHPARITQSLLTRTLDYRAAYSDEAEIARDVKHELEDSMQQLSKKKGDKGWVKGRERAKKWDDVRELRKEYRTREAKVVKNVMAGAQIVLSTCHGAGSRQLNNMNFDVCIIDEATQAMEAVCWIPVLKSKKLILAGDPLQLPPTILSANQKSSEIKVKLKPVDFPGNVARLDTSNSGVDPNGVSLDPTLGQAGAEAAEADTGAREMGTADIESVAEGLTILPLTEDRDAKTSDDTATVEDSMASKDTPTSANSMKENNAALKRPKLSPPRTLEMTLFDRLEKTYGAGIKRLLAVQYRMHASIAEFPSKALYASSLISHESVASRRLVDLPTVTDKDSEDAQEVLSPTLVFFDTAGTEMYERLEGDEVDSNVNKTTVGEGSRYNENEAEIVSKWVRQLISFGVPQSDIAIITPYQAQVAHLSSLLRNDFPELVCGSVDGMQGQEREAVILSLVRSNPEREVGFLAEYRRLNVAMTRAKRQLCVVGDSGTVGKGSAYLKQWMNFLEDHADVRWAGYHI